ncbi:hypothetical protein BASA50_001113 [Batrachochytrium salamandrivorans]|uniref:Secreted protein n=1 Tax=Batrachochytrium salamandrivorans TaxID=1357716 RepID=A0ABQ8ERN5_9FUNG|nr:hypothetical protein BASA62_003591 [Batrachochytrium salamandrivorans]KAH6573363.1 hypothetical protein BASA60_006086 [Batrachochytrium salamandrivorans]KAH6580879.1 hypothetical protein BASA61_009334 [Batrachochytrium salamandrivorans]KAH6585504.1 hypothetical protein BASA50_001113 [Batrachochytrium salamandrivorans]KAH9265521.1 hypothetical protein BASA83_011117 [Batrachochytrium salamandrivorans]
MLNKMRWILFSTVWMTVYPATIPSTTPVASSAPVAGGAHNAGEFVCIDDTKFMQFTSATAFVVQSCPPGFCFTRTPPTKNPCVGKENAQRIDNT